MKRTSLIVGGIILFVVCIPLFGRFYQLFFPQPGSIFVVSQEFIDLFIGLPLSYIFFSPLLFTAFGAGKKYWWLGILLLPAALIELYFDLDHIYFPILIGVVGWVIGFGIGKILGVRRLGK